MDKIIIFNVWWAMASYCEIWWKKIIIDIWTKTNFSPVLNFLIPYAKQNNWLFSVSAWQEKKYHIDQLIISHPHKDHLSDIKKLYENFYPEFVTTPNDNDWMWDEALNWELVFWEKTPDEDVEFFRENLIKDRKPPLKSVLKEMELYYIKSKDVKEKTPLADYTNNSSLVWIINLNWTKIMLPWDMMSSWMDWMLENRIVNIIPDSKTETVFKNAIKKIDILVAPHHWLESAFNTNAMKSMKDNLKLIIIPEKPTTENDKRKVHQSYYNSDYWNWIDILFYEDSNSKNQWTLKTSTGHVIIKWNQVIKVKQDENLLKAFS